jgi:S-adenosylmethionine hydrolase
MINTTSHTSTRPIIALLTDFGLADGYVGVLKGVMLGIAPNARFVDITHAIAPQAIESGAWIVETSYRYFPTGTIFLGIVDPGVGSDRQPIAFRAGNWLFVGPDNGLFTAVLQQQSVHEVVALTNPALRLPQVSTTFHGRDIFAPAAAHLAAGTSLSDFGPPLTVSTLQQLEHHAAIRNGATVTGRIAHLDTYGNLITNIPSSLVPDLFSSSAVEMRVPVQQVVITQRRRFFSESSPDASLRQEPFLYVDSSGQLGVAIYRGNASRLLNVSLHDAITLVLSEQVKQ